MAARKTVEDLTGEEILLIRDILNREDSKGNKIVLKILNNETELSDMVKRRQGYLMSFGTFKATFAAMGVVAGAYFMFLEFREWLFEQIRAQ